MAYKYLNRSIAEALYLSLKQNPFYVEIEGCLKESPANNQERMLRYFDYSMRESRSFGELYIPQGQSYGASVWSKPMKSELAKQVSQEKKDFILQNLGEKCLKKYMDIVAFMLEKAQGMVPTESWYLSILGVAPEMQGNGLGGTLITPVLEKADALGVPTYLETFSSRNIKFYQRLGYMEIGSFLETLTSSEYWIMSRMPQNH